MSAPQPPRAPLRLFEGYGIELEYMIVAEGSLDVRPVCDGVLRAAAGETVMEVERGPIAWSNELALHVIELKTNGPAPRLEGLAAQFQQSLGDVQGLLAPLQARLMPTAMHPWMDPHREMRLWPHDDDVIYNTYNRIFDCRGHGWANLQSVHINLPFGDDAEFARLHAAIRLVLPLIPMLAASSPLADGAMTGLADTRLETYRHNADRVPLMAGQVIPEQAASRAEYEERILAPLYAQLAPLDPEGVLRHEWANARGSIARFDRDAIEIRLVDLQECPAADLALCAAIVSVVRALVEERLSSHETQAAWPVAPLAALLHQGTRLGEAAVIEDEAYLRTLGCPLSHPVSGRALWRELIARCMGAAALEGEWAEALALQRTQGTLASRIRRAVGAAPSRERLRTVYGRLCDGLREGRLFAPA